MEARRGTFYELNELNRDTSFSLNQLKKMKKEGVGNVESH